MLALGFGPSLGISEAPRVGFDFGGGVLPPGASLTRASTGSRFDAAGVLRIEAPDVARFDHDPATGRLRGLLIEPERTNNLLKSQDIGDTLAWSGDGIRTTDGDAAPDGTATADHYAYAASGLFQSFICKADTDYVLTEYVRLDTIAEADFLIAIYDETHLSFIAINIRPAQTLSKSAWARIEYPFHTPPGCTTARVYLVRNTSLTAGVTAIFWGAGVEEGATPTSYIPTTDAAATRAADALTLDWGRLGVADGPLAVRYVFDDTSTQDGSADVIDGHAIVPPTLDRRWIRRIERR